VSTLADRIRGIVAPGPAVSRDRDCGVPVTSGSRLSTAAVVEGAFGGTCRDGCCIVERRWDPAARHGRHEIGTLARELEESAATAALFAGGATAPFVFFDLETTGLSGGAGTIAFLVGCAWFDANRSFLTRQFLLTRHEHERMFLGLIGAEFVRAGALVSFNGRSFDAPLLETRCLFHRLPWMGDGIAHFDALHPARRFWPGDCSLVALEKERVAARRGGDVPGPEIPARFFRFLRTGDARGLVAVLEHNRRDLLTLAALTVRLLQLAHRGAEAAHDAREAFALGITYARSGLDVQARDCHMRGIAMSPAPRGAFDPVRSDNLRALAVLWRRARRFDEAAACWRELFESRGCPPAMRREAAEALAIHHEHRVRDLEAAKTFALRSLEDEPRPAWAEAIQYRLARIDRKMNVGRLL
jgi:uncharacterized protein YprB with RNaseH-like and TPR domain